MNTLQTTSGLGDAEAKGLLPPGTKAGPWIVERELGRGGMGSVYAVHHEGIGKRAALKVIHQLLGPCHADRMLVEARVVNRVGHPNIIDIFETGALEDGRPYIVMERLDGVSLADRARAGRIPAHDVITILRPICDALIAAHDAGVIHRDLKTDNVFLVDSADATAPKVKLLDWGIAKEVSVLSRNTIEGIVVGTPHYLSPEQARGAVVTDRSDVYSLGVVAYELFLERLPFDAESAVEIMMQHLRSTPPLPRSLWADIPAELEDLLLAMLAKEPDQRPCMREVASRLEEIAFEIEIRRAAQTILPDAPVVAIGSAHGRTGRKPTEKELAATSMANLPSLPFAMRRTWQYAAGAVALAASTAFFVITHESDSEAETASMSAMSPVDSSAMPTRPLRVVTAAGSLAAKAAAPVALAAEVALAAPAESTPVASAVLLEVPSAHAPSLVSAPATSRLARAYVSHAGHAPPVVTTAPAMVRTLNRAPASTAALQEASELASALSFQPTTTPGMASPLAHPHQVHPPTNAARGSTGHLDPDATLEPYK